MAELIILYLWSDQIAKGPVMTTKQEKQIAASGMAMDIDLRRNKCPRDERYSNKTKLIDWRIIRPQKQHRFVVIFSFCP
jgi:hypothetical protein